jgi:hypothetical protein
MSWCLGAQCLRSSQRSLCSACELGTSLTAAAYPAHAPHVLLVLRALSRVRAVALVAGVAFLLASVVLQSVLQVPPPIIRHQVSAGEPVLLSQRSLPLMNSMV